MSVSESFLNKCLEFLVLVDNEDKNRSKGSEYIINIIENYNKHIKRDKFPNEYKDKIDFTLYFAKYRYNRKDFNIELFLDNLGRGKYSHLIELLRTVNSYVDTTEFIEYIKNKKKLNDYLSRKESIKKFISNYETGNYEDDLELMDQWENILSNSYQVILDIKKEKNLEDVVSLDLLNDDYAHVVDKIRNVSCDIIPSGFNILDTELGSSGFEDGRLYIFAGTSGVGKSTLLINLICNAVKNNVNKREDKWNMYYYITAENLVHETLARIYSCYFSIPISELLYKIEHDKDYYLEMMENLKSEFRKHKCLIKIDYVTPNVTTLADIESLIYLNKEQYNVKGLYLDYMDKISSGRNLNDLRLELGLISSKLKEYATTFNFPVHTVTQLNRGGYDSEMGPSLTQMSESMLKVNDADFVAFLQLDKEKVMSIDLPEGTIYGNKIVFTILKNRNGAVGASTILFLPKTLNNEKIFSFSFVEIGETNVSNEHDEYFGPLNNNDVFGEVFSTPDYLILDSNNNDTGKINEKDVIEDDFGF